MHYIIPALSAVVVALVGALSTVEYGRRRKAADSYERRSQVRAEESRLSMEMMSAAVALGLATAAAVEGRKINGEMGRAREQALASQEEYGRFLTRVAARQVAK